MKNERSKIYLVMDEQNNPLGRVVLEGLPNNPKALQFRLLEEDSDDAEAAAEAVEAAGTVHLLSMGSNDLPIQCKVVRRRKERVIMEKIATLDSEVRRNLRVPLKFKSFFYPVTGRWKGRRAVEYLNLSCGGAAFYCDAQIGEKEQIELVVPTDINPVLLKCEVLRAWEEEDGRQAYACKFINTCEDEETIVREAVFTIQLQARYQKKH